MIPAAVCLCVPLAPSRSPSFRLHATLGLSPGARVFLLPTNLRQVKDPLYLVAAFEAWHRADRLAHLVLVGPTLDAQFAARVKAEVRTLSPKPSGTCAQLGSDCSLAGRALSRRHSSGRHARGHAAGVCSGELQPQRRSFHGTTRSDGARPRSDCATQRGQRESGAFPLRRALCCVLVSSA